MGGKNSALYGATQWKVVTVSDSANGNFPAGIRAIHFNAAGNVAAVGQDDNVEVFTVVAGQVKAMQPKRINSTNTTVTVGSMIAEY